MKPKIIVENRNHLIQIISDEMLWNGSNCDLNHVDVSKIRTMESLFSTLHIMDFNGNISEWDVSNVENMSNMFKHTKFNGDISKWKTSKVKNMSGMFSNSQFNGDISKWDVSNVENMEDMFFRAEFNGSISNWNVSKVENMRNIFCESYVTCDLSDWKPYNLYIYNSSKSFEVFKAYWAKYDNQEERRKLIDTYWLEKELQRELGQTNQTNKKIKI
jgi:surface protein